MSDSRWWYSSSNDNSAAPMKLYFSRVESEDSWLEPGGLWVGSPKLARFLARYLNIVFAWWRNW